MRVIIDAKVIISYLLDPQRQSAIGTIFEGLFAGSFTLLLPEALLDEIVVTVRQKPRLRKRISLNSLNNAMAALQLVAEEIPRIESEIPRVTRDPKDDYLLAYAVVGEADFLVSGDKDLLVLEELDSLRIISPATFAQQLT